MTKVFIFFFALLSSTYSYASDSPKTIYTPGDPQSALIAKLLFPDLINIKKPGADGVFLWDNFLKDTDSLSIQTITSTHLLHLTKDVDFMKNGKLIAVITTADMYLFSHKNSDIINFTDLKNKNYSIGSTNPNGICNLFLRKIAKEQRLSVTLVTYKLPQQAQNDFLGKHINLLCQGGSSAASVKNNSDTRIVLNLSKDYNLRISQYLYAHKDITKEQEEKIINSLKNNITPEITKTFDNAGVKLIFLTGKEAKDWFIEDSKVAKSLYKFIEKE
jgi:tripartite-type tricarboxylate transporter receptor subunit TctC